MPQPLDPRIAVDSDKVCKYKKCSVYPNEDVAYNWLNYPFPVMHKHDHWEILLVTHGKLVNRTKGKDVVMSQGDFCLLRPNDLHAIIFPTSTTDCQHMTFSITSEYISSVFDVFQKDVVTQAFLELKEPKSGSLSAIEVQQITNKILNIRSIKIPLSDKIIQIKFIVNNLLGKLIEQHYSMNQNLPDWLTNFLFLLNDPYLDTTDVKSLATHTPYSYSRLATIFKDMTGRTVIEYITKIKIRHAEDLLRNTDMPITEICSKLNYESLSHFIRTFKRESGVTPSEFRKENKIIP